MTIRKRLSKLFWFFESYCGGKTVEQASSLLFQMINRLEACSTEYSAITFEEPTFLGHYFMVDYEIVVLDASIFSGINLLLKSPQEEVLGGLVGKDIGNGVWSIEHLWIAEKLQTQGWGTKFLQAFEAIAKAQNKHTILVDTFDYQAPQFYEKNGFECIEVVASHAGYTRHYYTKKI